MMNPSMQRTLIHNALIVTVDAEFTILENSAIFIETGRIDRIWTPTTTEKLPEADEVVDAGGAIVMPGLVNAHTHLPMSLFRGIADDLPLQTWLEEHIFPAEAAHIRPETVELGTFLSCAELLLSGTTTCCDGYFLAHRIAHAVRQTGLRAVLGQGVIDFPAPGIEDPSRNVAHAADFAESLRGASSLIRPSIFCHSPYTCSADTLKAAKRAAEERGVLFQIHVAETRFEAEQCRAQHGCSPVVYLDGLGLLDRRTLLVHAVWLDDADVDLIARRGAAVAHCPESNMKLGSGVAPVPDLLAAGVAVGLGTDGCASNNDLDMLGEMATAAKLHKVHRLDPTVADAAAVVRMATINGARALGMETMIGSLEPGKRADLIAIDLNKPHLTPLYKPASHLVYAVSGADVRHVMVDGRWLVRDRCVATMDMEDVMTRAAELSRTISGRKG